MARSYNSYPPHPGNGRQRDGASALASEFGKLKPLGSNQQYPRNRNGGLQAYGGMSSTNVPPPYQPAQAQHNNNRSKKGARLMEQRTYPDNKSRVSKPIHHDAKSRKGDDQRSDVNKIPLAPRRVDLAHAPPEQINTRDEVPTTSVTVKIESCEAIDSQPPSASSLESSKTSPSSDEVSGGAEAAKGDEVVAHHCAEVRDPVEAATVFESMSGNSDVPRSVTSSRISAKRAQNTSVTPADSIAGATASPLNTSGPTGIVKSTIPSASDTVEELIKKLVHAVNADPTAAERLSKQCAHDAAPVMRILSNGCNTIIREDAVAGRVWQQLGQHDTIRAFTYVGGLDVHEAPGTIDKYKKEFVSTPDGDAYIGEHFYLLLESWSDRGVRALRMGTESGNAIRHLSRRDAANYVVFMDPEKELPSNMPDYVPILRIAGMGDKIAICDLTQECTVRLGRTYSHKRLIPDDCVELLRLWLAANTHHEESLVHSVLEELRRECGEGAPWEAVAAQAKLHKEDSKPGSVKLWQIGERYMQAQHQTKYGSLPEAQKK